MSKIELLLPAKDLACGLTAINHGADAVYTGAPAFGARQAVGNSLQDIEALVKHAHLYGSKVHVTVNTLLYDNELESARKLLWERGSIEIPTALPLIAAVVSIVVKEGMFQYTMYYARKLDSAAFKADAWHHRSDAVSSVGSFAGIGLAKLGLPFMDPVASLIICVLILKVAFDICRDAVNKMLDTSCDNSFEQKLHDFIGAQEGVERIDLLRTRQFGNKIYVDLEIAVESEISLREAHRIAESVHSAVEREFPNIKHIMIHVNPKDEQTS